MSRRRAEETAVEQSALATRLRETRDFLNLSQRFVSEQTGLTRSAISEIEGGKRKVDALELKRLSRLYRFPVSYFLGETDEETVAQSDTVHALSRAADELPEEDRQQMLRFALFLRGFDGDEPGGRAS